MFLEVYTTDNYIHACMYLYFHLFRKMDFHHLKRVQREEMKETTVFYHRIKGEREAQEKKSDIERQEVERRFEGVADQMTRKQRKELERLEQLQLQRFKSKAKSLKVDQVLIQSLNNCTHCMRG